MASKNYEYGVRNFADHLAQDAIAAFYRDHNSVHQYFYNLARRVERLGDSEDPENLRQFEIVCEEARGAAYELARAIAHTSGDDFSGATFTRLEAAAREEAGLLE